MTAVGLDPLNDIVSPVDPIKEQPEQQSEPQRKHVVYYKQVEKEVAKQPHSLNFDTYHEEWMNMATASPQDIVAKWKAKKKLEQLIKHQKKVHQLEKKTLNQTKIDTTKESTHYEPTNDNNAYLKNDDILNWTKTLDASQLK